ASVINTAIEAGTGKDVGGHVVALFKDDGEITDGTVITASAEQTIPAEITAQQNAAVHAIQTETPHQTQPQITKAAFDVGIQGILPSEKTLPGTNPQLFMGLEWKGKAPDIHKNIENAGSLQGESLTEDQLSQILGSFRVDKVSRKSLPSIKATRTSMPQVKQEVQNVTAIYEKQTKIHKSDLVISDSFDYLTQLI
ncbi:MAG: hypothetical protein JKX94_10290, partial [Sneathiella sp.]|nr:hypothetical protein [Sneathiella sp.]